MKFYEKVKGPALLGAQGWGNRWDTLRPLRELLRLFAARREIRKTLIGG